MSFRQMSITCTMLAAAMVAIVGTNANAEQNYYNGGCAGGCADSGCTSGGCTDGGCSTGGCGGSVCGGDACGGCGNGCGSLFGGKKHSWRLGGCGNSCGKSCGRCKGSAYEGLDPHFNCGCNGSYNFPVPPLSTYMWPGMYKHQLMTEYDNPWRFPPIKAYTDEAADIIPEDFRKQYPQKPSPPVIESDTDTVSIERSATIQPVSTFRQMPTRRYAGSETMSQKMERYYSSQR